MRRERRACVCPPVALLTPCGGPQEVFVIDGAMSEDDSEFEYRISLQTEDGTEEDSVQVAFRMAYSASEDVKRWMRAGVLDRFKLLSPPDGQPSHKLWEALPPLPATLLSHGGVVRWSRERAPLLAGALLHMGTWPSLADVVLVEGSDLGECKARGYECVPIPDDSCSVHHAHDGGASSDGETCGWSVEDAAVVRQAAVLFVPCTGVDLVQDRVLPLLEQAVVLVSSEPDWGEGGGWPGQLPLSLHCCAPQSASVVCDGSQHAEPQDLPAPCPPPARLGPRPHPPSERGGLSSGWRRRRQRKLGAFGGKFGPPASVRSSLQLSHQLSKSTAQEGERGASGVPGSGRGGMALDPWLALSLRLRACRSPCVARRCA